MLLTEKLYKSAEKIWDSYLKHSFIKEIGLGSLELDKFKFYMIQDYLYLIEYSKVFALGILKSSNEETMRIFSSLVYSTLNDEMKVHKLYMEKLKISKEEIKNTKPSLANISYTNYMLWQGNNGDILDIITAVLSCSWSYAIIGKELNEIKNAAEHEFYGDWIKSYSSKEYINGNDKILELLNNLGSNISNEKLEKLINIFLNCSRYEYMFWDMAYNKEM